MNKKIIGFGYGLLSSFCGVFTGIMVKCLNHEIPTTQLMFIRFLIGFFILLPIVIKKESGLKLTTTPWLAHIIRAILGIVSMFCCYYAIPKINFTDYMVIGRTYPLIMIALSLLILKEKRSSKKLFAAFLAVMGAVIAVQPDLTSPLLFIFVVIFGISIAALSDIFVKKLTAIESCEKIILCFFGIGALVLSFAMPFVWVAPSKITVLIPLLIIGISGLLSQYFITKAYKMLTASTVGVIGSSQLIWAVIFGVGMWNEAMGLEMCLFPEN